MSKLLLLDNHDSFTWNLAHYLEELGAGVEVVLSDAATPERLLDRGYAAVLISPGAGRPEQAGTSIAMVRASAGRVPLLGVCLGHQALGAAFGARVVRAPRLMHGKTSRVFHDGGELFRGLPRPFEAMRYHSLALDPASVPPALEVTARSADGTVMAVRHRRLPLYGVQFHPESILTTCGKPLLANFLSLARRRGVEHAA